MKMFYTYLIKNIFFTTFRVMQLEKFLAGRRDSMTYNEKYRVKRLSPDDRRQKAEIAARQRLVKQRRQPDIEDDLDENEDDGEDWLDYAGPLGAVTRRYDYELPVVPPRRTARVDHYHDDPYFTRPPAAPTQVPVTPRKTLKVHWFVYAGICLVLIVVCHYLFNDLGAWWQDHQDYSSYGMPRTYQTDAVVGHNDSNSNPSHFIAINLRGSIYLIETTGWNMSHARA